MPESHDCTSRCPNCGGVCQYDSKQHHGKTHPMHKHEWMNDKSEWQNHLWRAPSMKQQKEAVSA